MTDNKKDVDLYNDIYSELCSVLGKETAEEIFKLYKGQQITFPVHFYDIKKLRKHILKEYTGNNIKELTLKYGYSEKTIRRMLKGQNAEDD